MKRILLSFMFLFTLPLFAKDSDDNMLTAEEILAAAHTEQLTTCASKVFAEALDDHRYEISESAPEAEVRAWAQVIMFDKDVLQDVLKCPEIQSVERRYVRRVRSVVERRAELNVVVAFAFFVERRVRVFSRIGIDVVYKITHLSRFAPAVR